VSIEFDEENARFDIGTAGGGLRALLNTAVILHFTRSGCLLLDEPDAHLHGTLQTSVARMLADHAGSTGNQMILTTHSPDFISEMPVDSLRWVDRTTTEARSCDASGRFLVDLGSITKADALRTVGVDKVLFVEGSLDRKVLSQLFATSCYHNPLEDPTVRCCSLPDGKSTAEQLATYNKLLREMLRVNVKLAAIVDNDYDLEELECEEERDGVLLLKLKRKEVENYLLDPEVISSAAGVAAHRRAEKVCRDYPFPSRDQVEAELQRITDDKEVCNQVKYQVVPRYRSHHGNNGDASTVERKAYEWFESRWNDPAWRLRNCPGKAVLRSLREWCQQHYQITLTDSTLIKALESCPDDVREIARQLTDFFGTQITAPTDPVPGLPSCKHVDTRNNQQALRRRIPPTSGCHL
jgi:hypothetical protein